MTFDPPIAPERALVDCRGEHYRARLLPIIGLLPGFYCVQLLERIPIAATEHDELPALGERGDLLCTKWDGTRDRSTGVRVLPFVDLGADAIDDRAIN